MINTANRVVVEEALRKGMIDGKFSTRFREWLLTHWFMWERFEQAALKVRDRGIKRYSAFVIVNVLRYRADVEGNKFSMTNTFVPDIARLFNAIHDEFFNVSTRKQGHATN